jgi:hypothetical protein
MSHPALAASSSQGERPVAYRLGAWAHPVRVAARWLGLRRSAGLAAT